jgi:hypothetical protein
MNTTKVIAVTMGIVAALGIGAALYQIRQMGLRDDALAASAREQKKMHARLAELEQRLTLENQRAKAAEEDNAKLLHAIERARTSSNQAEVARAAAVPVTREMVQARFTRGRELLKSGDRAAALAELTWCYDEGMVVGSFRGVRSSFLVGEIARLAKDYPPADTWLREKRAAAEKRMQASSGDREATLDFASITSAMGDRAGLLATFDAFPPGDERRAHLGVRVFEPLLEARRYKDAAEARSFSLMNTMLSPGGESNASARQSTIETAAKNIEVLAGAGDLERARTLMQRLFAIDASSETRAILQQHLTRAGQPQLLPPEPKP